MIKALLLWGCKTLARNMPPLILAFIVGAIGGAYIAHDITSSAYKREQLQTAIATAQQGAKTYAKLSKIRDDYERSIVRASAISDELKRVRRAYTAASTRARAGDVDGKRLERCERLLYEGTAMVGEGGELLQREQAKRRALADAIAIR